MKTLKPELEQHINDPKPGDVWDEGCFVMICVVVRASRDRIVICRKRKSVPPNHWTWDLAPENLETVTKDQLREIVRCCYKCWPESHAWVEEHVEINT